MNDSQTFEAPSLDVALEDAAAEFAVEIEDIDYKIISDEENNVQIEAWVFIEESEEEEHTSHYPTKENMTDEELDEVADTAIAFLRSVLVYFGAEDATIDEYEGEAGEIILDIVGENMAVLIGRHGRTLDALQSLVTSATNKALGFRYPLIIDAEGYRNRQRQKLEGLAYSAANRAVRQGSSVRLRPMTPYERRLVHIALRDDDRVETASEGREPNRKVVVTPV